MRTVSIASTLYGLNLLFSIRSLLVLLSFFAIVGSCSYSRSFFASTGFILSARKAAMRRGPSGKRFLMSIVCILSGNASLGTAMWKPWLPLNFTAVFSMS